MQPGAFFLGCSGPRSDAVFRTPRTQASGWNSEPAGLGGSGGLQRGSEQLRVLARRRSDPVRGVLSYAYPEPPGFAEAPVQPPDAFYSNDLREFILPYDAVRQSELPDHTLLEFLRSTYAAAANLAQWDRTVLERSGHPRDAS